jgi:hypothetical protein
MESLRQELEPQKRWDPGYQYNLASAYMNRALVHEADQHIPLALSDFDAAIDVTTALADRFPAYFCLPALQRIAYRYDTQVPAEPTPALAAVCRCVENLAPARLRSSDFPNNVRLLIRALTLNHPELATKITEITQPFLS